MDGRVELLSSSVRLRLIVLATVTSLPSGVDTLHTGVGAGVGAGVGSGVGSGVGTGSDVSPWSFGGIYTKSWIDSWINRPISYFVGYSLVSNNNLFVE